MIELFAELPEEIKERSKAIIDYAIANFKPEMGIKFLQGYINSCENLEEQEFINFYFQLRMEQLFVNNSEGAEDENNSN